MAKKKSPLKPKSKLFNFRCDPSEIEEFRRCAMREGFSGNISAWLLWHLRRIVRESSDQK